MMADFSNLTHFNDSSDTGRPGLRAAKKLFRPVEMHGLFGARERPISRHSGFSLS
jgi:hypothetical protein